jgi:hypothetical protein
MVLKSFTKIETGQFNSVNPSKFVILLAKYNKAMYTLVSLGLRCRIMFETEEFGVGINDLNHDSIYIHLTYWLANKCFCWYVVL